ncbi:MAG: hypothetical protein ABI697_12585 [Devosia sp.]
MSDQITDQNLRHRRSILTSTSVVAFALTLFGAGAAMLMGAVPLRALSTGQVDDAGLLVIMAAIVALILAVCVEVSRIAISSRPLPQPRAVRAVRWTPGRREG